MSKDEFKDKINYPPKKNKKFWLKNKDIIVNNFNKLKKIQKYTFSNYNKITILLPNGNIKHNAEYTNRNEFYLKKSKNFNIEVIFNNSINKNEDNINGLPMHTECWNIAKNTLNHKLT